MKSARDEVGFSADGKSLRAEIYCEIDHHVARRIRERIDERLFLERPTLLIIDFSAVRFMDSSGIALIFGRVESAAGVGATVRLEGLSPGLKKLVCLSGAERIRGLSVVG